MSNNTCNCNSLCTTNNNELKQYLLSNVERILTEGGIPLPGDIYIVSQSLVGTILVTTLNNGNVFNTDMSALMLANLANLKEYADSILIDLIGAADNG